MISGQQWLRSTSLAWRRIYGIVSWSHCKVQEAAMRLRTGLEALSAVHWFDNWPMLLLGRVFDRGTGLVVYRKQGLEILIDHRGGDANGTRHCLASSMYRKFLRSFDLRWPVRVLDLGAMGGGFPLLMRIMGIEMAQAVCVEMNPQTYQRLLVNLTANLGPACAGLNAAVCGMEENSELLLKPSRGNSSFSMYTDRADASAPHETVCTTTLQALYDRYFKDELVDICKIDIEGAEYEVFDKSPDELLRRIRYLIVEFHDPQKTPAVIERLTAIGFAAIQTNERQNRDEKVKAFRGPGAAVRSSSDSN
jgi:FkbM family methyltransferase